MSITVEMQPEELEMLHRLAHQEALSRISAGDPSAVVVALRLWLLLDRALDRYEREEEGSN